MKKIDKSIKFLQSNLHLFQCPHCNGSFHKIAGNSLVCFEGHSFDISRKGTIHFLTSTPRNEYNREMLEARQRISRAGFFKGIEKIFSEKMNGLKKDTAVLDVGCGEGSLLARCDNQVLNGSKIFKSGKRSNFTEPGRSTPAWT